MDISGSPLENMHKSRTDRKRLHTKYKMFSSAQGWVGSSRVEKELGQCARQQTGS